MSHYSDFGLPPNRQKKNSVPLDHPRMTFMKDARTGVWAIKIFPHKQAMDDLEGLEWIGVGREGDRIFMREPQTGDRRFKMRRPKKDGRPHLFIQVYDKSFEFDITQAVHGGACCQGRKSNGRWEFRLIDGITVQTKEKVQ